MKGFEYDLKRADDLSRQPVASLDYECLLPVDQIQQIQGRLHQLPLLNPNTKFQPLVHEIFF